MNKKDIPIKFTEPFHLDSFHVPADIKVIKKKMGDILSKQSSKF